MGSWKVQDSLSVKEWEPRYYCFCMLGSRNKKSTVGGTDVSSAQCVLQAEPKVDFDISRGWLHVQASAVESGVSWTVSLIIVEAVIQSFISGMRHYECVAPKVDINL